jgi:hypothetical protein
MTEKLSYRYNQPADHLFCLVFAAFELMKILSLIAAQAHFSDMKFRGFIGHG